MTPTIGSLVNCTRGELVEYIAELHKELGALRKLLTAVEAWSDADYPDNDEQARDAADAALDRALDDAHAEQP